MSGGNETKNTQKDNGGKPAALHPDVHDKVSRHGKSLAGLGVADYNTVIAKSDYRAAVASTDVATKSVTEILADPALLQKARQLTADAPGKYIDNEDVGNTDLGLVQKRRLLNGHPLFSQVADIVPELKSDGAREPGAGAANFVFPVEEVSVVYSGRVQFVTGKAGFEDIINPETYDAFKKQVKDAIKNKEKIEFEGRASDTGTGNDKLAADRNITIHNKLVEDLLKEGTSRADLDRYLDISDTSTGARNPLPGTSAKSEINQSVTMTVISNVSKFTLPNLVIGPKEAGDSKEFRTKKNDKGFTLTTYDPKIPGPEIGGQVTLKDTNHFTEPYRLNLNTQDINSVPIIIDGSTGEVKGKIDVVLQEYVDKKTHKVMNEVHISNNNKDIAVIKRVDDNGNPVKFDMPPPIKISDRNHEYHTVNSGKDVGTYVYNQEGLLSAEAKKTIGTAKDGMHFNTTIVNANTAQGLHK